MQKKRIFYSFTIVSMLIMIFGGQNVNANQNTNLSDLETHWAKATIKWAINQNIVTGYEDGTFKPNKTVSEAEFLTMLIRTYLPDVQSSKTGNWADSYYEIAYQNNYLLDGSEEIEKRNELITRLEVAELITSTQGKHYEGDHAIQFMYDNKLASGSDPNKLTITGFKALESLTRAEAVQFIKNLYEFGKEELQPRPLLYSDVTQLTIYQLGEVPVSSDVNLHTMYVDQVQVAKSEGQPISRAETMFVPVEPAVKGMGDKLTWFDKPNSAMITKKDGTGITIYLGRSAAMVNGKSIPISTKVIKTVNVPVPMKPTVLGGKLYVPVEFLKEVLGYNFELKTEGNSNFVIVGKAPASLDPVQSTPAPTPTPNPKPSETWKPDLGYLPPAGWTPPKIKSTSTDDGAKDTKILEKELGFTGGYAFNVYKQDGNVIGEKIIVGSHPESYVNIEFKAWYGEKKNAHDSNKIPYIARELFKFYFPNNYMKLWNIINDGVNGKDVSKYVGTKFTLDNREVKIVDGERSISVIVSKKK
ncbi:S-layer homology domain-containing protein [Paenibacillus sp. JX-17]|uniref:S-layer homology domain-containing protein n=1 Tax=Paenibacillus lacisoli TaxID=3064525 RepID=A0ABT9CDL0_9BACL|nr:S-layer homology domain-containing protein [Paenibacillus sp. JX-17]MDO7906729.1 S-layer homology domain-containing protein [Paenibacillus sp. JX-17]